MRYEWRDPRGALWHIDTENRIVTRLLTEDEQQHPQETWWAVMDECQTMGLYTLDESATRFVFHKKPGCGETAYRHITRMSRGLAPESPVEDVVNNLNRRPERAQGLVVAIIAIAVIAALLSCLGVNIGG